MLRSVRPSDLAAAAAAVATAAAVFLLLSCPAHAQDAVPAADAPVADLAPLAPDEAACVAYVRANVDWDRAGGQTAWRAAGVRRLCAGTVAPEEPGRCYDRVMYDRARGYGPAGDGWTPAEALALCEGTNDGAAAIGAYNAATRGVEEDVADAERRRRAIRAVREQGAGRTATRAEREAAQEATKRRQILAEVAYADIEGNLRYYPDRGNADCDDFGTPGSQAAHLDFIQAQRFFGAAQRATGLRDPHGLDPDGNGVACEALLPANVTAAEVRTRVEAECASYVQGQVTWDAAGRNSRWSPANVERLCAGTVSPKEPAVCFDRVLNQVEWSGEPGWTWETTLALCEGTSSSDFTVRCAVLAPQQGASDGTSAETARVCAGADTRRGRPTGGATASSGGSGGDDGGDEDRGLLGRLVAFGTQMYEDVETGRAQFEEQRREAEREREASSSGASGSGASSSGSASSSGASGRGGASSGSSGSSSSTSTPNRLGQEALADPPPGFTWLAVRAGAWPAAAQTPQGQEGGAQTHVCRARYGGMRLPGTTAPTRGGCTVAPNAARTVSGTYEVLAVKASARAWMSMGTSDAPAFPARAVPMGVSTDGTLFYTCRVRADTGTFLGMTWASHNACRITGGGRARDTSRYAILVAN